MRHFMITGAGSGIGRAIAHRLYREGCSLTLLGRRLEALEETAQHIDPQRVQVHSCDIQDAARLQATCVQVVEKLGAFHGVVANAGIGGPNEPGESDRFVELVQTNLIGTYQTLRAVQPHLHDGLGHMVVISSCLARFGVPGYSGYCASKAGLLGMVRALAHELAPSIQVNAICPGWVDTQMARDGIAGMAQGMGISYDEAYAQAMSVVPLGRMSKPEEIAGTVAWLVSDDAQGMTGQGIDINAGSWMG